MNTDHYLDALHLFSFQLYMVSSSTESLFPTKWCINTSTIYGTAGARIIIIRSHDPSPPGMLSWGFMTSGNSGGVDRGAMTTGSNSPSRTQTK